MNKTALFLCPLLLCSCGGGGASEDTYDYERKADFAYEIDETVTGPTRTGYEIFVGTFADSNSDGLGDLKGIQNHLDYLKSVGAEILWLTPIHPSNTYHHYDVLDYYSVAPKFGSVNDFASLAAAAKEKGMTIILDMVFNHASTGSEIFKKALEDYATDNAASDSKKDWFCFSDAQPSDIKEGQQFRSVQSKGRTVWYECDFDTSMADFNLDSEAVRAFHKDVMEFWIGKGAGGFRFDGVAYYYAGQQAKNTEYAGYLASAARSIKQDVYLVSENWEKTSSYTRVAAFAGIGQNAFNFRNSVSESNYSFVSYVNQKKGTSLVNNVVSLQSEILKKTETQEPVFFLSNHDQDRVYNYTSLFRTDRYEKLKCIASLYLLTPGTPFMYYGEEIGLQGSRGSANTDANRRLPMIWQPTGDAARCLDPEGTTYSTETRALEAALKGIVSDHGLARHYKKVNQIRAKFPAVAKGVYNALSEDAPKTLAAFSIAYKGETYALVTNLDETCGKITLPAATYQVVDQVTTVGVPCKLSGTTLFVPEYSSVLLKLAA